MDLDSHLKMMEFEKLGQFIPEKLYGDYADDMFSYLSLNPSCLIGEAATRFQDLIHQHCDRVWISKEFALPSFDERYYFGEDAVWLNTARSLKFDDLKKKVFVLDFFTYCCINCIHILPLLKKVEDERRQNPAFAVIGIHSPKFPNEKNLDRVKDAIIRNDIRHPVLNDPAGTLWKLYDVSCWPTVFIVGPEHTLLFILVGEAQIDKLPFLCHHVLKYFESISVELDLSPLPILPLEKPNTIETSMSFPGSVSTNGNSVIVSDTGNNRLLMMSKDLKVQEVIGCGKKGFEDGHFNAASFNAPNGTTWYNGDVYVADTGNHSIRKVDLVNKAVYTVFKSEDYAYDPERDSQTKTDFLSPWDICVGPKLEFKTEDYVYDPERDSQAETDFLSPWDICVTPKLVSTVTQQSILYIAVAGSHQIWALDLDTAISNPRCCVPFAGSGKEENKSNSYRMKAGFAQPSGIAYSPHSSDFIYVADSESSTIKTINLVKNGAVQVLVGGGRDPFDLFQFGDHDGKYIDAKLQHPLSVCVLGSNVLAVTDTYNHKIKVIDVNQKTCTTLNANVELCEPSSLCLLENSQSDNLKGKVLLIADTNNHRIVPISLFEYSVKDILSHPVDLVVESHALATPEGKPETEVPLAYDGIIYCHFKWNLDPKFKLNPEGSRCDTESEGDGNISFQFLSPEGAFGSYQPSLKVVSNSLHLEKEEAENHQSKLSIVCHIAVCNEDEKLCSCSLSAFKVLIKFAKSGPKCVNLFFIANCLKF